MELEISAREHGALLSSSRATERKKSAECLKDLLTRNALPSLLTKNTHSKNGFSWNLLFLNINDYVLKETEKYESSKSFYSVTAPLCTSLLHMCVAGANKGKAFVKCDKIIDACLFILRNGRLSKAIGDAYLNLLHKHVLTSEHYLGHLKPTNWEDLLDICINFCTSNEAKFDNYTKMRLLSVIIKNGTKYCQFVIPIRDSITKLKKEFLKIQNDKKSFEVFIEIVILLLEVLSAECRLLLCEFTECMLPLIVKYYDRNLEQKKKNLLFKLLELIIMLHHPKGKLTKEDGSLAHKWDIWDRHINNILEVITLEISYLQRVRKQSELDSLNIHFCSLAAAVYYQVFHSSADNNNDNEASSSAKKQKLVMNKYITLSDLIYQLQLNHVPWLPIIYFYIKKYKHTISTKDYLSLIKSIEILVINSNNLHLDWDTFQDMSCLIIKNLVLSKHYREDLDEALLSLWNSCVRNSSSTNEACESLHTILRLILETKCLNYQNIQPLIKLYVENGMPVNNSSVMTLNSLISSFFNKYSSLESRSTFLNWLSKGGHTSVKQVNLKELLLRLIANDNINVIDSSHVHKEDKLFNILFNSIEKSILFSEFEYDYTTSNAITAPVSEKSEINSETNKLVQSYLESFLHQQMEDFKIKSLDLLQYSKSIIIALTYVDVVLKYNFLSSDDVTALPIFKLLITCWNIMFVSLVDVLKSNSSVSVKIKMLQNVQELLMYEYEPLIALNMRLTIKEDFFHYANNILISEPELEDDLTYDGDDNEMALKYNFFYTLAAYCRIQVNYRKELLDLILDSKLYDFSSAWDVECAYRCIEILISHGTEDPPLSTILIFMQSLCKDLFRVPKATFKQLSILYDMLDPLWDQEDMKQNSFIMIKGYLERCEKMFYPPNLAALIYKCASKIVLLNAGEISDVENMCMKSIIMRSKGNVHCLRLYCCYLLKSLVKKNSFDIDVYLSDISDIFVISVPESQRIILKDESANRTSTILHNILVLATAKKSFIHNFVYFVLKLQKEKSLDKPVVKKVLNIITTRVDNKTVDAYLNRNILSVLYFWLTNQFHLSDLPLTFLNIANHDELLNKHMKWIVSADILWRQGGSINDSLVLNQVKVLLKVPENKVIEICFSNIIVLCLPYIVCEKYNLSLSNKNSNLFKQSLINANRLFQKTRQMLETDKWSNLFVENIGELLLLTTSHLADHVEASEQFHVALPDKRDSYTYNKIVFSAILKYFGELTDGDIMQYLCENQPVAIFKILLKLWENVLQEEVLELKVLSIHAFKTFVESVPLVEPSNAFISIYVCNCFGYAIKKSRDKDDLKVLTHGLKLMLPKFLPKEIVVLRKALSQLISVLILKKEEGFGQECSSLLNYLIEDMKEYLKEEDVVDFIKSMSSQRSVDNLRCSSSPEFLDRLKSYKTTLASPSYESLLNLHEFLKMNKQYVNVLCKDLENVRFSEDSGGSLLHQIIHKLNDVLKSTKDHKIILEACNSLSEVGTYDLKTLVTVPASTGRAAMASQPRHSLAIAVVNALAELLFDENPAITGKITKTLNRFFQYTEGVQALDLVEMENQVLKPFISDQPSSYATFQIDEVKFSLISNTNFLIPDTDENHEQWLIKITIKILDILASENNYLNTLKEVCVLKPEVCTRIIPALLGLLLFTSLEKHIKIVSTQINHFFEYIWEISFDDRVENSNDSMNRPKSNVLNRSHKLIIQIMLRIINFVRLQKNHYTNRHRYELLNYLNLDYNKVAWAATVADRNLTAIYYGELWTVAINNGVPPASPDETSALSGGKNLQRIMRKSFVSIGEMDAIDGCGTAHLTTEEEKLKHLINTGQYLDALLVHDISLSCSDDALTSTRRPKLRRGVLRSLHKSGMHHLALQYIKAAPESERLDDIKYDCLSVLGDWSDFVDTRDLEEKYALPNSDTKSILTAFRYSCLKDCLNIQIKPEFEDKLVQPLNRAKMAVTKLCQELNMENCQNVYKILSKLHLFTDIEDYFAVRCNKLSLSNLLVKWSVDNLPAFQDFKYIENLISQRNIMLEHSAKYNDHLLNGIVSLQLQYAELSLSNQRIQTSQRLLAVVKKLQNSDDLALLESQISWAKGHKDIALSLLRNIVCTNNSPNLKLTAESLRQYGLWMAESKSDNARDIINKYLKKSLQVLKSDDVKIRQKVYFDIAKFADAEYKQVVTYMSSSIFENKVKCLENMKDTASSFTTQQSSLTREERKAQLTNERFKDLEEADIINTRSEKETFLRVAMRYYLLSLKECEENNLSVFRVISLWLANPAMPINLDDGESFERMLLSVPSRKFIAVLPQLAPRLSEEDNAFAENLRKIITRCAIEHPHHTLPILFSLMNSDKDKSILNVSQAVGKKVSTNTEKEPRVVAAEAIVKKAARANAALGTIVAQMELLCDATISFANYKPKGKEQKQKIPTAEMIQRLINLNAIPIPTITVPIRTDCNYKHISTLVSFDKHFELVGGINCPKKVNCLGSNGIKKILLIKGEDDLRQDAVMQQVFNIVNNLLEKNAITNKKKLIVRTYKVVPMSRQSGVLEWCDGTIPVGFYLVGSGTTPGAHSRYRPMDISCQAARLKLTKCQELRKSYKERLAVFLSILREFKPVFHYFFTEHYLDPVTWYERRLAYTKSVATSSMVGHILGLGDRHVQNILIDKNTAEVIHIDFGIAFDQGKALPTPETIPFRLTQDIISGFGCSGVEGIFRRSCEKTMQLLRDNQETLLTILEVLLCDPLYSWTVRAAQPAAASKDTSVCGTNSHSGLAERALLSVSSKLSGTEGGAGGVAVPAQVARLISTATDPANLCRLFQGWQPYL